MLISSVWYALWSGYDEQIKMFPMYLFKGIGWILTVGDLIDMLAVVLKAHAALKIIRNRIVEVIIVKSITL